MEPAMWPGDLTARLAEIADRADFSILDPDLLIRTHRTRRRRRIVLSSAALALTLAGSATALLIAQTGDGKDKLTPSTSRLPAPTPALTASPALSGYKARLAVIAGEYAKSQGVGVSSAKAVMTNCRGAAAKTCIQVTGTDVSGPPHIWLMAIVTDRVFTCRSCKGMGFFPPSTNIAVALDADTWKDLGSGIGGKFAIDIAAVGEPVQIVG